MNVLPPCKLLEFDLSGVEAVLLGWYSARLTDDPMVIRFAKLGLHALVCSHLVKEPADTKLPDAELAAIFKSLKKRYKDTSYDTAKRTVHGTGYGMTPEGMCLMFPTVYRDLKHAQQVQGVYFEVCPPVPKFQLDVKMRAAKQNYLGGPCRKGLGILDDLNAHPFTYRHEFFNVVEYRKLSAGQVRALQFQRSRIKTPVVEINGQKYGMKWGPDAKRALAFYPQSTNSGCLNEMSIELFDEPDGATYIGNCFYGRTPLRAPIHDSLFMEVPFRKIDFVAECAARAMQRPVEEIPMRPHWGMGAHLTIGVEAKIGDDWDAMEDLALPSLQELGVSNDGGVFPAEEADEEEFIELRTAVA